MAVAACIMAAVVWGFWNSNQKRLESLGMQGLVLDEAGVLTSEERSSLAAKLIAFRKRFGQRIRIITYKGELAGALLEPGAITIAMAPETRQVALMAPPLVRKALGEDFMNRLADSFYAHSVAGSWGRGADQALDALCIAMAEVAE